MNLALTVLLALPAATPPRFEGNWTIVSVEHNGKTTNAEAPVAVKNNRLVLNEGKGEQITIEFDANNRAWLWAGNKKPPTAPPPPEKVPLLTGPRTYSPDNQIWIINGVGRPMIAPTISVPAPVPPVLATPGFYLQVKDQLQIYFLPIGDSDGPSLTLILKREAGKP